MSFPILTFLTFFPVAGAVLLIFVPKEKAGLHRTLALAFTLITFFASLALYFNFDGAIADPQFVEKSGWLGYGINYHLGVDGISLWLVLLTTFLMPTPILSSSTSTLKFVLMTMFGSLLMLVAIFALYSFYYKATGTFSLEIFDFYKLILNPQVQGWLFLGFALSFALKVPMFPFHTWLPDAHVEAPTAGSVLLAAVLLKMGTYGFLRFALPLFPDALEKFL